MEDHVFVSVQNHLRLQKELSTIIELKKEAFRVFDISVHGCALNDMMSVYNSYWQDIFSIPDIHMVQSEQYINTAFTKVSNALITRTQFKEYLQPTRMSIEAYIISLEVSLEESRQQLIKLYDEAFSNNELSFIFMAEPIKDSFIKFLIS